MKSGPKIDKLLLTIKRQKKWDNPKIGSQTQNNGSYEKKVQTPFWKYPSSWKFSLGFFLFILGLWPTRLFFGNLKKV
jgi:hypothetical protein